LADERARTPKPIAVDARDARVSSLAPNESFVLSRIDGVLDEHELAMVTSVSAQEMSAILATLAGLGLIALDGVAAPPPAEEDVDIDAALRKRVSDLFARLDGLDHYGVLGVASEATKKEIKRAYFEYASAFHPDKHFRKRLGSYKAKMEVIFARATTAHDVLTDKEKRAEYDAYLVDQRRARGIEDMLKDALAEMAAAEEAVRSAVPEIATDVAPAPTAPVVPAETPSGPRLATAEEAARRRDALARRLLGNRALPTRSRPATPAATPNQPHATAAEAMDALKRRYEDRVASARAFQAKKYSDNARAALAQNDPVAAANALRVAVTMDPTNAELKRQYEETQAAADAILSETYTRQATYEEKNEQWSEAAKSWARVVAARPNEAHCHERAANAMVRAGTNLHEAAKLAQTACAIEPANHKHKVTLANVYLAAGLTLNAKRELEAAAQLSPQDDTIQALLKRVSK